MSELNQAQREAVHTTAGPLLVLAGAGTGKTRVITFRIAELIRRRTKPQRILAVTFTNKAAREMRERALGLLGRRRRQTLPPEISTFHSLCVRILRRHAEKLGYPQNFTIYDRGDQETVARSALREIRVGHQKLKPGDLLAQISGYKCRALDPAGAQAEAENDVQHLAAHAYERYQVALKTSGAVDFDDLLSLTERLFDDFPEARFAEASRFDHVLIDEYQDTNSIQYRIVKALAERHRNLCVVGDDDQSIYGWRGAEVTHILNFQRDWPDAKVVRLEENYRSTPQILELANTLILHNGTRHEKTLRSVLGAGDAPRFIRYEEEAAEAEKVVAEIKSRLGREAEERLSPSDIAILFRTNEQPRAFETELRRWKIPYVLVGGMSFYDRKEIKDLLAYLKVLGNPRDEVSLLRIINTPSRGIGAASINALLEHAVSLGVPLWEVLAQAATLPEVSEAASQRIQDFARMIDRYRQDLSREPLSALFTRMVGEIDYRSELARHFKNPGDVEARWATVEELVNAMGLYESRTASPTLSGFLEETALNGRENEGDDSERREHAVTLMTLHSAKGLEFPCVYLVGLEEGLLPHRRSVADGGRSIEEERRLCYVGVTRAQRELTVTFCKSRMKWGKARPSLMSRFVMEMRGDTERARRIAEHASEIFRQEPEEPRKKKAAKRKRTTARRREPARRG